MSGGWWGGWPWVWEAGSASGREESWKLSGRGSEPRPPFPQADTLRLHQHTLTHTHGGAHRWAWAIVKSGCFHPGPGSPGGPGGSSSEEPLPPLAAGRGLPGSKERREGGRRKPLLCVLFLVRKVKWFLGANKRPSETRSLSLRGPPSRLFPAPQPAPHLGTGVPPLGTPRVTRSEVPADTQRGRPGPQAAQRRLPPACGASKSQDPGGRGPQSHQGQSRFV